MTRAARRGLGVLVAGLAAGALLVMALAAPARADDAEKEARRLFQKAELSFNVGKFAEALTDYQAAYQAKPLPGFLFNIAQCYRNMGDQERARFFFRRYLALEPRAPNKRRVEELIDEMTKQLEAKQAPGGAAPTSTAPAAVDPAAPVSPVPSATTPAEPPPTEPTASPAPSVPPAPAPAPQAGEAPPVLSATAEPAPARPPIYTRWWFWTAAVVVVAGGAAATYLLTRPETRDPGTLPPIDASRGP